MKSMHIGLSVSDLNASINFYNTLFGAQPTVVKTDYAKWMLDDPRVNFSISTANCEKPGDLHLGIQVEDESELETISSRLANAGEDLIAEPEAVCCYHKSAKTWVLDPQALRWETFLTHGESTTYGKNNSELEQAVSEKKSEASCC